VDTSPYKQPSPVPQESELTEVDIRGIEGVEMSSVEFAAEFVRLRFDGPALTMYSKPHLLFTEFSIAFGEPEYRNALCSLIGEQVTKASFEEGESLTIEFDNGSVVALSLREEDSEEPVAGAWSESGDVEDEEEF
jgi:hypothetical protein